MPVYFGFPEDGASALKHVEIYVPYDFSSCTCICWFL